MGWIILLLDLELRERIHSSGKGREEGGACEEKKAEVKLVVGNKINREQHT